MHGCCCILYYFHLLLAGSYSQELNGVLDTRHALNSTQCLGWQVWQKQKSFSRFYVFLASLCRGVGERGGYPCWHGCCRQIPEVQAVGVSSRCRAYDAAPRMFERSTHKYLQRHKVRPIRNDFTPAGVGTCGAGLHSVFSGRVLWYLRHDVFASPKTSHPGFLRSISFYLLFIFIFMSHKACPSSDGTTLAEETYGSHTYQWWADVNGSIAPVRDANGSVASVVAFHRYSRRACWRCM